MLTQYKSDSLNTHIARGWRLPAFLDLYVEVVPAQQRTGGSWFKGSADAIHQSLNVITDESPDHVAIFGGDHMYKMDVRQMVEAHISSQADATVAVIPVPLDEARSFGILEIDDRNRVVSFDEKPQKPKAMPGRPGWALASMGNYMFQTGALIDELARDASGDSAHDFGRNILPEMVARGRDVYAYDFSSNEIPGSHPDERGYWRDVGTIAAYWKANMDLVQVVPQFDLYNPRWPLRTWTRAAAAGQVRLRRSRRRLWPRAHGHRHRLARVRGLHHLGRAHRSHHHVAAACASTASPRRGVDLDGRVEVGRYCAMRRAIIDKGVRIPPHTEIGYDPELDARRFTVSAEGIVVVPKRGSSPSAAPWLCQAASSDARH